MEASLAQENKYRRELDQSKNQSRTDNVAKNIAKGGKNAGRAAQAAGMGASSSGAAMQGVGKGLSYGGRGLMAGGRALSSTRVGAIVGAPMMAAGRLSAAAGTGLQGVGKGVSKTGRSVTNRGRNLNKASSSFLKSMEDTSDLTPRGLRNKLNADRKASKEFRKKAEEAVKARLRAATVKYGGKIGLRFVNAILGFSGFGLVVVLVIMLYQGFFGNLLRLPKVTKLSGLEIGILALLTIAFLALYIFVLMLVSLFSDPWRLALEVVKTAIEKLLGIFK